MVIITAAPNDVHALTVAKRLYDLGEDCCVLNAADFPSRCQMHVSMDGATYDYAIRYGGETIRSESVKGLWLRRFHPFEIDPAVLNADVRRFAYDECREFFQGWASTVRNVINSNLREGVALRKVHQLRAASEVGLRILRTLIGNDPGEISRFSRGGPSEVVYKVLSHTTFGFFGTQLFTPDKLDRLLACRYSPTIFQERISVKQNLRVTIVDTHVFAAEIRVKTPAADLDWRLDMNAEVVAADLPETLREQLLAFLSRLGLRYGAIDLIRNDADEYVFLEVNPGGQFLWVEIATGMPISIALALALSGRGTGPSPEQVDSPPSEGVVVQRDRGGYEVRGDDVPPRLGGRAQR